MSKDVKFNVRMIIDGKETVVQAAANVEKLAKELGIAKLKGEDLRHSLIQFNQLTQTFQNVLGSLQQLTGVLNTFADANAVQVEAETKLETVMKQRMKAREADIQSIKDLASAQQQLGVIGDEVQLMGAQQIATFLTEKASLEALIPAMNNLLAQQKGLNATGQDAVSIGNLIGKAMQGQTSALTRVGITFNAAQEQMMKFGTESERAATLAQIITDNVGQMNAELANTNSGRAQQMANAIGDIKEQVGALYSQMQPAIIAVGQLGMAFSSLVMAVSGVTKLVTTIKGMAAALRSLSAMEVTFGATTAATTTAVTGLSVAIKGLMAVTGIGLAIVAVTSIIAAFWASSDKSANSLKKLRDETDRLNQSEQNSAVSIASTRSELELNIAKLKDFNGTKQQEKTLVEEMNNKYGETMGYFSSVSDWYKALTANSEAYCKQMIAEAKARSLANQIANIEEENRIIGQNIVNDKYSKENEKKKEKVVSGTTSWGSVNTYTIEVDVEGTSELDKARAQMQDNYSRINDAKKEMQAALKEMADTSMQIQGAANRPTGGTGNPTASDKQLITDPKTYKDLQNNISYYQQELDKTNQTDTYRITVLSNLKAATEKAAEAFKNLTTSLYSTERNSSPLSDSLGKTKTALDDLKNMKIDLKVDLDEERISEITEQWLKMQNAMQAMETMEGVSKIAASVSQLGQSMAGLSEESRGLQVAMAGVSVAAAIAQLIAVMVKKLSESFSIWDFIAGTIAGTAAVVSAITQLKNVAAFAQGGIVSGPTMALVGEYVGAQNNPEVIAPLDKLRSMIEPAGFDGGNVHFKIAGRDLVGVIEKEYNHNKRS